MVLSYLDRVREAVEDESVVRPVVTACAAALSPRIGTGSAEGPVMDALLIALLASAFAEMGDRTQLLAMVLALRFRNDPAVLSAIMLATIVNCAVSAAGGWLLAGFRSEEHTSELQSLMRISYAVFCLKKKNKNATHNM